MAAAAKDNSIWLSSDSGRTWSKSNSGIKNWKAITCDDDGEIIYAVEEDGKIYKGVAEKEEGEIKRWEWSAVYPSGNGKKKWSSITCSDDGTKVFATVKQGKIYKSLDNGTSWSESYISIKNWSAITCSANGVKVYANVMGGGIYRSTNTGSSWVEAPNSGNRNWSAITCSDGSDGYATNMGEKIYKSNNNGANWAPITESGTVNMATDRNWSAITCSSNGGIIYATTNGTTDGKIYKSTNIDIDITWTEITSNIGGLDMSTSRNWSAITCSNDGNIVAGTVKNGKIYISSNSGDNFTPSRWERNFIVDIEQEHLDKIREDNNLFFTMEDVRSDRKLKERLINLYNRLHSKYTPKPGEPETFFGGYKIEEHFSNGYTTTQNTGEEYHADSLRFSNFSPSYTESTRGEQYGCIKKHTEDLGQPHECSEQVELQDVFGGICGFQGEEEPYCENASIMFRVDNAPSEYNDKKHIKYLNYDQMEDPVEKPGICLLHDNEDVKLGCCNNPDIKNEWLVEEVLNQDYHLIKSIERELSFVPSPSPSISQDRYQTKCLEINTTGKDDLHKIKLSECQTNEVPQNQKIFIKQMGNIHACPEPE